MDYYQAIIILGMFCQCQSITVVETMFSVAMAGSNLSFIIISLQVQEVYTLTDSMVQVCVHICLNIIREMICIDY